MRGVGSKQQQQTCAGGLTRPRAGLGWIAAGELDGVKAEAAELEEREKEAERSAQSSPRSAAISPRTAEAVAAAAAAAVPQHPPEPPAVDAPEPEPSRKKGGRMTQEEWDEIRRERQAAKQGP